MRLPFRVALMIPPDGDEGNSALLDVSELRDVLARSLPLHNTTFFDGYDYGPAFLDFEIDWKVSMLPPSVLSAYEASLARFLRAKELAVLKAEARHDKAEEESGHAHDRSPAAVTARNAARRRREEALRRGVGVPVSVADDFLLGGTLKRYVFQPHL